MRFSKGLELNGSRRKLRDTMLNFMFCYQMKQNTRQQGFVQRRTLVPGKTGAQTAVERPSLWQQEYDADAVQATLTVQRYRAESAPLTHTHSGYIPVKQKARSSAGRAVPANTNIPQSLKKYKHLLFWCVTVSFLQFWGSKPGPHYTLNTLFH